MIIFLFYFEIYDTNIIDYKTIKIVVFILNEQYISNRKCGDEKKRMYKYDVALSYESKSQDFVKEVAGFLRGEGWNVFFAPERKEELLSENLKSKLYQVYQNESLVKVLFVTKKYLHSQYTMLEARCSLNSVRDNSRRLIVVNFVQDGLPKELKPFVYLEGNSFSNDIAYLVSDRIKELKKQDMDAGSGKSGQKVQSQIETQNYCQNNSGIIFGDSANLNHVRFNNLRNEDGRRNY